MSHVYIIISHKHSLKAGTKDQWETTEQVEFVDRLRKKHHEMSTAIASFTDRRMLTGARYSITDYTSFIDYIRKKYPKQLAELESQFGPAVDQPQTPDQIQDMFGNTRSKTVFDL
jgi:hypothetical protein